jgi:ubiquinone/menaquinone biosynthesis C-methylase UbiE
MLNFTGERFIPTENGEIRYEHMHRYGWVQALCVGRRVLDIACGEGYGSALLAKAAASVVGVDISSEVVSHATERYAALCNLVFRQGSAICIPVDSSSVDLVVSFETIEHLAQQEEMLSELRRVLKPSGVLVISSPNKKMYSDDRNYVNEFHVKELYFDEFDALLGRHFSSRRYFAQRFVTASALLPRGQTARSFDALLLDGVKLEARTKEMDREMYFVAVCAVSEDLLPPMKPNLFLDADSDLYSEQQAVMQWASGLDKEYSDLQQRHLTLQKEFDERSAWALSLDAARQTAEENQAAWAQEQARLASRIAQLSTALAHAQQRVSAIESSKSWRLLAKLRKLAQASKSG